MTPTAEDIAASERQAFAMAADIFDPPANNNFEPLPHQTPPSDPESPNYNPELGVTGWFVWLLLAGRGAGKTQAASIYVDRYARANPGIRIAIIAPTLGDARSACVDGPSGLLAANPDIRVVKTPDYYLRWPNGSRADIYGAHTEDDVERLRAGGNRHLVWAEELAAWRYLDDAWDQMEFGLRLGTHPHVIASTTPKNRVKIKQLVNDPKVIVTRGTTLDNPHLHETARARLLARYEGTRIGQQELFGEIIEDVAGALWTSENLERHRVTKHDYDMLVNPPRDPETGELLLSSRMLPRVEKLVVAVDPAVSSNKTSDETGIVTVGRLSKDRPCPFPHPDPDEPTRSLSRSGCLLVLSDSTLRGTPEEWGSAVVKEFHKWEADKVIGEVNNGGDLVEANMKVADNTVPFKQVRASRGKAVRAEPVSALYEQGKVHHVGGFPELEEQMTTWEPDSDWSPDRLDALVWGATELGVTNSRPALTLVAPAAVGENSSYWKNRP